MVKRGNSGSSRSRGNQGQSMLSEVDDQKAQKFKNRLNEFRNEREWSRDTFERDLKDLNNVIETVEELITDIQVQIRKKEGIGEYTSDEDQIIQSYGQSDYEELKRMGSGEHTPGLHDITKVWKELYQLSKKRDQWIAYQSLLQEIAKKKLYQIAMSYKNDRIDSEVAERLMDYIDDQNERFQKNAEKDLKSMIRDKISEVESKVQRLETEVQKSKNEARRHRRISEELVDALKEETGKNELVEELMQEIEGMKNIHDDQSNSSERSDTPVQQNNTQNQASQENQVEEELGSEFVDDEPDERPSAAPEESDNTEPSPSTPETQDSTPEGVNESELETQFSGDEEERGADDDIVEEVLNEDDGEDSGSSETDSSDVEEASLRGESTKKQYEELKRVRNQFSDDQWNSMSQSDIADLTDASRPYLINEILEAVYSEYETAFGITSRYED